MSELFPPDDCPEMSANDRIDQLQTSVEEKDKRIAELEADLDKRLEINNKDLELMGADNAISIMREKSYTDRIAELEAELKTLAKLAEEGYQELYRFFHGQNRELDNCHRILILIQSIKERIK